jgi:hypothetical protein
VTHRSNTAANDALLGSLLCILPHDTTDERHAQSAEYARHKNSALRPPPSPSRRRLAGPHARLAVRAPAAMNTTARYAIIVVLALVRRDARTQWRVH